MASFIQLPQTVTLTTGGRSLDMALFSASFPTNSMDVDGKPNSGRGGATKEKWAVIKINDERFASISAATRKAYEILTGVKGMQLNGWNVLKFEGQKLKEVRHKMVNPCGGLVEVANGAIRVKLSDIQKPSDIIVPPKQFANPPDDANTSVQSRDELSQQRISKSSVCKSPISKSSVSKSSVSKSQISKSSVSKSINLLPEKGTPEWDELKDYIPQINGQHIPMRLNTMRMNFSKKRQPLSEMALLRIRYMQCRKKSRRWKIPTKKTTGTKTRMRMGIRIRMKIRMRIRMIRVHTRLKILAQGTTALARKVTTREILLLPLYLLMRRRESIPSNKTMLF